MRRYELTDNQWQQIVDLFPSFIYQIVINNQIDATQVEDIRVPVFWGNVPFVYVKHRPLDGRFLSRNNHVVMQTPESVLSREELGKIGAFCRAMQLDYGELDVLRCRDTKRIYIVDVNNTPGGPARSGPCTSWPRALPRTSPSSTRTKTSLKQYPYPRFYD